MFFNNQFSINYITASHLVMAGIDLTTVKEILRHKSIEMTMRYAHLSPEHKISAVDALEASLTASEQEERKHA